MEISIRGARISGRTCAPAAVHPEILFGMAADHELESGYDLLRKIPQILFPISAALKSDSLEPDFYAFPCVRAAEKKNRAFVHQMKGGRSGVG